MISRGVSLYLSKNNLLKGFSPSVTIPYSIWRGNIPDTPSNETKLPFYKQVRHPKIYTDIDSSHFLRAAESFRRVWSKYWGNYQTATFYLGYGSFHFHLYLLLTHSTDRG